MITSVLAMALLVGVGGQHYHYHSYEDSEGSIEFQMSMAELEFEGAVNAAVNGVLGIPTASDLCRRGVKKWCPVEQTPDETLRQLQCGVVLCADMSPQHPCDLRDCAKGGEARLAGVGQ